MPADKLRAAADNGRDSVRPLRSPWHGIGWWMVAALGLTARVAADEPVVAPSRAQVKATLASKASQPREKRILLFTASWCGPCAAIKGDLHNPERTPNAPCARLQQTGWKVGTEASNHIQVVDVDEAPELLEKFQIEGLPTLVLIENGREVRRIQGSTDEWTIGKLYKGYDERLSRNERKADPHRVAGS